MKVEVKDGFEERASSILAKRTGNAASKVQQLIDIYELHPSDAEVLVSEVVENLKVLKRSMVRR